MKNNEKALNTYIAHKAKIDAILERLQTASADHFDGNPEDINWGDVGFISDIERDLQNINDRVFKEGEHK